MCKVAHGRRANSRLPSPFIKTPSFVKLTERQFDERLVKMRLTIFGAKAYRLFKILYGFVIAVLVKEPHPAPDPSIGEVRCQRQCCVESRKRLVIAPKIGINVAATEPCQRGLLCQQFVIGLNCFVISTKFVHNVAATLPSVGMVWIDR